MPIVMALLFDFNLEQAILEKSGHLSPVRLQV